MESEVLLCARPSCGKKFVTKSKSLQKYCGKRCREKNWVENNRKKNNARMRAYRASRYQREGRWRDEGPKARELKQWMKDIKSGPCVDCGGKFPICCMDFDHKVGTTKSYNVGSMFAHHYSRELIEQELEKCDLVCSNCRRIRTKIRRTGSGKHGTTRV